MSKYEPVTAGIDLGGTSIRVGLYDRDMRLLSSRSMPTRVAAGPQSNVEEMADLLRALAGEQAATGCPVEVLGMGIGSPGPIDLRSGVLGLLPNLQGWENFPLRDALAEATGLAVVLESDANAAAIAEWKLGAGRATGLQSLAMMTLGTGVGSGLILDGKVWHGIFGMGGEVGHTIVQAGGLLCGCGSRGCLEMYASANAVLRFAHAAAAAPEATAAMRALAADPAMTPRRIAELAEAGDSGARGVFERLGRYLGLGIANLINTLDLPMIVVGGGVASAWPLFAPAMFEAVRENSVVYRLLEPTQRETMEPDRTYIRPAMIGPSAGLLGAALLPRLHPASSAAASLATAKE